MLKFSIDQYYEMFADSDSNINGISDNCIVVYEQNESGELYVWGIDETLEDALLEARHYLAIPENNPYRTTEDNLKFLQIKPGKFTKTMQVTVISSEPIPDNLNITIDLEDQHYLDEQFVIFGENNLKFTL